MHYSISDTAEYGSIAVGPRVVDAARQGEHEEGARPRSRTGRSRREWIAEMDKGSPSLAEARQGARRRRRSSRSASGCARSGTARCRRRMASVDVPVALLGLRHRRLGGQPAAERAGGRHRARDRPPAARRQGARARPRQASAAFPPDGGVLTTDVARDPRRPVDRDRRRGDGRRRAGRRARARAAARAASTSSPRTSSSSPGAAPSSSTPPRARASSSASRRASARRSR